MTGRGGAWQLVPDDTFAGAPYYRQALPSPNVTQEAFTVEVGDRWVASMTTYEWTKIKLVSEMRGDIPAPLRPIVPYRLLVGMFNRDWHTGVVAPVAQTASDSPAPCSMSSLKYRVKRAARALPTTS
jgi:hypothetical protein